MQRRSCGKIRRKLKISNPQPSGAIRGGRCAVRVFALCRFRISQKERRRKTLQIRGAVLAPFGGAHKQNA